MSNFMNALKQKSNQIAQTVNQQSVQNQAPKISQRVTNSQRINTLLNGAISTKNEVFTANMEASKPIDTAWIKDIEINALTPLEILEVTCDHKLNRISLKFNQHPGEVTRKHLIKQGFWNTDKSGNWQGEYSKSNCAFLSLWFDLPESDLFYSPSESADAVFEPAPIPEGTPAEENAAASIIEDGTTAFTDYQKQVNALCEHYSCTVGDLALIAVGNLYREVLKH